LKLPLLALILLPRLTFPLASAPQPRTIQEFQKQLNDILVQHGIPGSGIVMVAPDRVLWAGGTGHAEIAGLPFAFTLCWFLSPAWGWPCCSRTGIC
jgi:hypothetical protein